MVTYLLWWGMGGAVGIVAGLCVLRARGMLRASTVAAYLPATFGFLYGAQLQFRLGHLSVWQAIAIPPAAPFTPGYHVPLGLVLGFMFAALACLVLRVPVLEMGDALAVTGAAMMPIGRIGCLLSGCCAGVVCGPWFRPLCLTFPPGTEAYLSQVQTGLITSAAPVSLPAHPLQLYFGAAGLAVLTVLLWLMRRPSSWRPLPRKRPATLSSGRCTASRARSLRRAARPSAGRSTPPVDGRPPIPDATRSSRCGRRDRSPSTRRVARLPTRRVGAPAPEAGLCLDGDRIVLDGRDDQGWHAAELDVGTFAMPVVRVYGRDVQLRGLVLRGTQSTDQTAQADTIDFMRTAQRSTLVDAAVFGPSAGDSVGACGGGGTDADANVIADSEIRGARDKGIKAISGAVQAVTGSCVADNRNGGIQATLDGRIIARENVVQHNVPNSAQNGISANDNLDVASSVTTRGNIVRFAGGRGLTVVDNAVGDFHDDYVARNQNAGAKVETTRPDAAPQAAFSGVALVCNKTFVSGTCSNPVGTTVSTLATATSGRAVKRHSPPASVSRWPSGRTPRR
jgi:prolipoprotein diacylglyceryltransferase